MKYWNKSKYNRDHWTVVKCSVPFESAKRWCQLQEGKRFFAGPYTKEWMFESTEDALAFKLKWAVK